MEHTTFIINILLGRAEKLLMSECDPRVGDAKASFSNIRVNYVLQNVEKQSKNVLRSCIAQGVQKASLCRGWLAC
jgi:hypothetical protein